jgi:hypothetical protein
MNKTIKNNKIKGDKGKNENIALIKNKTLKSLGSSAIYKEGWVIISIKGEPYERGFQHGVLLKKDFYEIKRVFELCVELEFNISFQEYLSVVDEKIKPVILKDYPEFYEELRGMSVGFGNISLDYLIAWNAYLSLGSYFKKSKQRCSAFIATGDATEKGDIVMAHNTHAEYFIGQIQNVIIYVYPTTGHSFVMQSAPGYIASGTDWFVCSTGIVGCETTISSINYQPDFGSPYFCRIRQAMQYGKTLDEYVEMFTKFKLKVAEAEKLGYDTIPKLKKELEGLPDIERMISKIYTYSVKQSVSAIYIDMAVLNRLNEFYDLLKALRK